ncbi:MAG: hypothetical protein KJN76_12965, partial [Eudoraea sp.]|nr:hypothetical protein [Eudoraea sp.]
MKKVIPDDLWKLIGIAAFLLCFANNSYVYASCNSNELEVRRPASISSLFPEGTNSRQGTEKELLRIESNSFNAKKRSGFTINGITEHLTRGLTIVHFIAPEKFEFRTFDTHGSEEEASSFLDCLKLLIKNKATYAVLAHDSASKSLVGSSRELAKMGFKVLSTLKSRQAYVMNNFNGSVNESVSDLSIQEELNVPKS